MPYKYLEEIAIADVAFEAMGKSLEELFVSAAQATTEVMIHVEDLKRTTEKSVSLSEETVERLLYEWLSELIFLKDTEGLLFSGFDISIEQQGSGYALKGKLSGESINREQHKLLTDVKAITMHMFEVKKTDEGWKAVVVVDV